jgi:lipopolysaccharide biosynthesis protein
MTKIIALYFPQLHPIPENDQWWGKGFTDWVNVKKAKPLYPEHYQPRIPLNSNYYDQSQESTIRTQVQLAREYGVEAFCHYHYWFDGKQLLETPTNIFLENKDINIEFCLAWANETWSRQWDGQDYDILQLQTHPPDIERWSLHFDYLIKAWTDERAIKIDDKPIFLIYRPHKIKEIANMFDYWKSRAKEYGLQDIFFVAICQNDILEESILKNFDAIMLFQPFFSTFRDREKQKSFWKQSLSMVTKAVPIPIKNKLKSLIVHPTTRKNKESTKVFDYDQVWNNIIIDCNSLQISKPIFWGGFVDWDNTARYGNRATIFSGANPDKFRFWLRKLIENLKNKPHDRQFIFINAWNEWAESAYLEPDETYQYKYLEALKNTLDEQ